MKLTTDNIREELEYFIPRWHAVPANKRMLEGASFDKFIVEHIIDFIEEVVLELSEYHDKEHSDELDRHKYAAVMAISIGASIVAYEEFGFEIFFREGRQTSDVEQEKFLGFLTLDIFFKFLQKLDYQAALGDQNLIDHLRFMLVHGYPDILSLAMIGYLLEEKYPLIEA